MYDNSNYSTTPFSIDHDLDNTLINIMTYLCCITRCVNSSVECRPYNRDFCVFIVSH